MKTTYYLKKKLAEGFSQEQAIEQLTADLAIKAKVYQEDDLVVLNYNQIELPKTNPIVIECRGLILKLSTFEVVSRSFDRFFNIGEVPETCADFDITRATVFEKADGSLIKLYRYDGRWNVSTRGTAFAETENYTGSTFSDMVCEAFQVDNLNAVNMNEWEECTFIFEFTSPLNRVVTPYDKPEMILLAIRNNRSGEYHTDLTAASNVLSCNHLNHRVVKTFDFKNEDQLKSAAESLPNLQEGYVCWDSVSNKRIKIKSPAYLAVHKLRGETTPTPKRIMALVLTKEQDEYLAYFPEDKPLFDPYTWALVDLENAIKNKWEEVKQIESQKDFAMKVKTLPYSGSLFQARGKGQCPVHCFHQGRESYKMQVLSQFVDN